MFFFFFRIPAFRADVCLVHRVMQPQSMHNSCVNDPDSVDVLCYEPGNTASFDYLPASQFDYECKHVVWFKLLITTQENCVPGIFSCSHCSFHQQSDSIPCVKRKSYILTFIKFTSNG